MEAMHKVSRHEASLRQELQEHWVAVRNDRQQCPASGLWKGTRDLGLGCISPGGAEQQEWEGPTVHGRPC